MSRTMTLNLDFGFIGFLDVDIDYTYFAGVDTTYYAEGEPEDFEIVKAILHYKHPTTRKPMTIDITDLLCSDGDKDDEILEAIKREYMIC